MSLLVLQSQKKRKKIRLPKEKQVTNTVMLVVVCHRKTMARFPESRTRNHLHVLRARILHRLKSISRENGHGFATIDAESQQIALKKRTHATFLCCLLSLFKSHPLSVSAVGFSF